MFQIGEFSKITQVSVRMLRYYDQNDLLHPALIDDNSGYRYYLAEQIDTLHQIIRYREEDVDIEACIQIDSDEAPLITATAEGIIEIHDIPGIPQAACFMIYGPYSNIDGAYKEFAYWLESHPEYHLQGPSRQICHISYDKTDNEEEFVTEMIVPISYTQSTNE